MISNAIFDHSGSFLVIRVPNKGENTNVIVQIGTKKNYFINKKDWDVLFGYISPKFLESFVTQSSDGGSGLEIALSLLSFGDELCDWNEAKGCEVIKPSILETLGRVLETVHVEDKGVVTIMNHKLGTKIFADDKYIEDVLELSALKILVAMILVFSFACLKLSALSCIKQAPTPLTSLDALSGQYVSGAVLSILLSTSSNQA